MWTPFKSSYAYGWVVPEPGPPTFGHQRLAHGGGINGFSSGLIRVPEKKLTSIVLANSETSNAFNVARDLLAIAYGEPYTLPVARTVAAVDPKIFDEYAGKYELKPGFVLTVTREGNSLMAQATGQGKFALYPESETVFFAKVAQMTITFTRGDGRITHLVINQGGQNQLFKRLP